LDSRQSGGRSIAQNEHVFILSSPPASYILIDLDCSALSLFAPQKKIRWVKKANAEEIRIKNSYHAIDRENGKVWVMIMRVIRAIAASRMKVWCKIILMNTMIVFIDGNWCTQRDDRRM